MTRVLNGTGWVGGEEKTVMMSVVVCSGVILWLWRCWGWVVGVGIGIGSSGRCSSFGSSVVR